MDAETFESDLEADYETELSRLGSSKAMYAATEGEMETDRVTAAIAARLVAAASALETWADVDPGAPGADEFEAAAGTLRDLAGEAGEPPESPEPVGAAGALAGLEAPSARAGGFLAWTLVTDRTLSQAVAFFVGNADARAADRFRGIRSEIEGLNDRAGTLLERVCTGEAEGAAAVEAGASVVEAAYDHYVETLEGLGVKVKPVC